MNLKFILLAICVGALMPLAQATPVNVTVSGGSPVVAAPSSDLGNFGDATVFSWMVNDVAAYNSIASTTYGAPSNSGALIGQTGGGGNSISLDVSGYQYLFFHWGGSQLQPGGWAQLFYVGDSSGSFTFDNSAITVNETPAAGGISFYSLYGTNVPDGGSTVMMLGAALSGLGVVARRMKK
jgi:hypothetical protein